MSNETNLTPIQIEKLTELLTTHIREISGLVSSPQPEHQPQIHWVNGVPYILDRHGQVVPVQYPTEYPPQQNYLTLKHTTLPKLDVSWLVSSSGEVWDTDSLFISILNAAVLKFKLPESKQVTSKLECYPTLEALSGWVGVPVSVILEAVETTTNKLFKEVRTLYTSHQSSKVVGSFISSNITNAKVYVTKLEEVLNSGPYQGLITIAKVNYLELTDECVIVEVFVSGIYNTSAVYDLWLKVISSITESMLEIKTCSPCTVMNNKKISTNLQSKK